jgi:hypothetical protein
MSWLAVLAGSLTELQAFLTAVGRHAALHSFSGRRPAVYCKLFPQLTRHCDFEPCVRTN